MISSNDSSWVMMMCDVTVFCNATWDTILCWPATPANTVVNMSCPDLPRATDPTSTYIHCIDKELSCRRETARLVAFSCSLVNICNCRANRNLLVRLCTGSQGVGLVINRSWVQLPAVHCRVSTWMGDRLRAGKPSQYVTTVIQVNSAFHPSGVGKSSASLSGWG